jgi:hypothetical protein
MTRAFATLALLAILLPGAVLASHGGWEYAEPLGWDEKEQKAYFMVTCVSESDRGPFVIYFDMKGTSPEQPIQTAWSKGDGHSEGLDSLFAERLAALRARLRPFVETIGPTVFHYNWETKQDSVESIGGGSYFKRFKIRVSDNAITSETFEVTTLVEPVVRMTRKYRVGETGPAFGILSFRGIPVEMGYETQVPVLLLQTSEHPHNAKARQVEWIRWE